MSNVIMFPVEAKNKVIQDSGLDSRDPERWKMLCFRLAQRTMRLKRFKKLNAPQFIITKAEELIDRVVREIEEFSKEDANFV